MSSSGDNTAHKIVVRPARADDAPAVSLIHRSDIIAWKSWDADGSYRWTPYQDLAPYQRWMNGGPWMDEGLCRRHIEHMSGGSRLALVAELDGAVCAEAEVYLGEEPPPFGRNLNLSVLYTRRGFTGFGIGTALMRSVFDLARERRCETLSVSSASAPDFYSRFGLARWQRWGWLTLPGLPRNTVYQRAACELAPAALPAGWGIALGGIGSAAQMWDRLDPDERPVPDEAPVQLPMAFDLTARSGRERARVVLEPRPHALSVPTAYLWTPEGRLTPRLWAVLRDCTVRLGFGEIHTWANRERPADVPACARWEEEAREVWGLRL
jgi:GNAT superfamily N-acetyltransferase